jgi:peptidoglycan hydrolase-like protein with peptidoglycan-binding domain
LLRRAYDAYACGDLAAMLEVVDPDLEWTYLDPSLDDPQAQVCHGRHELEAALARQARQGLRAQKEQPMTTGTISPWPLTRKGDQQHPVQTLQYLLRARGHSIAVDGIFGPQTDAAVRGFQQALHQDIPLVTVDGIVGPVTWQALVSGMLSL